MRIVSTLILALISCVGCAGGKRVMIATSPPGATLKIDGQAMGPAPMEYAPDFKSNSDFRHVVASLPGYKDTEFDLTPFDDRQTITIELERLSKWIVIEATRPSIITVNDQQITPEPASTRSHKVTFVPDASGKIQPVTIRARARGWDDAVQTVTYNDGRSDYKLVLSPKRKPLKIQTNPPGAQVFLNGELLGVGPIEHAGYPFPADGEGNLPTYRLGATKVGYEPASLTVRYDDGQQQYLLDLVAKSKRIRIITEPPGATVQIEGVEMRQDGPDAWIVADRLQFPVDEQGRTKTYTATASKPGWKSRSIEIDSSPAVTDYRISLEEVTESSIGLIEPVIVQNQLQPKRLNVLATKETQERNGAGTLTHITPWLPEGSVIGSIAVSPDAAHLAYTLLSTDAAGRSLFSEIHLAGTDRRAGAKLSRDEQAVDLMPSFSPDGERIIFTSARGGTGAINVWSMTVNKPDEPKLLTIGQSIDLWPSMDSDPRERLFYESLDAKSGPAIYVSQRDDKRRAKLTPGEGMQPRVSPKADGVVYVARDAKTGKRDLYWISDKGGQPTNLTNSPDDDDCEPAWSSDGGLIAYASDRTADPQQRRNYNIWVLDMKQAVLPRQITANESHDDKPAWDPAGNRIYFRSNRGQRWGIWVVNLKK